MKSASTTRHDPLRNRRLSTVELQVDEHPAKPGKSALLGMAYGETELRQRIKKAGGIWHPERKLWRFPLNTIKALKLDSRMLKDD